MFPFKCNLESILKTLIFIHPNLNCYRHSVSKLLIVEPLSVLRVRNQNQSLDVVLPSIIFDFKFFFLKFTEFLVHFIVRLIW